MTVGECASSASLGYYTTSSCTPQIGLLGDKILPIGGIDYTIIHLSRYELGALKGLFFNLEGNNEIPDENLVLQLIHLGVTSEFNFEKGEYLITIIGEMEDFNDYHWDSSEWDDASDQTWTSGDEVGVKIIERITCP